jgi:hypothetical protein
MPNTSSKTLTMLPRATPTEEHAMSESVVLSPRLEPTVDETATPRSPPVRQANKRVCTIMSPWYKYRRAMTWKH